MLCLSHQPDQSPVSPTKPEESDVSHRDQDQRHHPRWHVPPGPGPLERRLRRQARFEASQVDVSHDGSLTIAGDLTIKDQTHPLQATGTITGPAVTFGDVIKLGVTLETVIHRTQYGLNWNAPLPKGGFALADDVKLTVELELAREEA